MGYPRVSYDKIQSQEKIKPLMLGCSGGGGHIAAIEGISEYLKAQYDVLLTPHQAVLYAQKPQTSERETIILASTLTTHSPTRILSLTPFPNLPAPKKLEGEIKALSKKEEKNRERTYIDMLLDVYPAGYESVAIWNVSQRNEQTSDLRKLVNLQPHSDKKNYHNVLSYFINALQKDAKKGEPYTELISTQAMALPALCDAVIEYNQWIRDSNLNAPLVQIHQYMTDLPTRGAIHFFKPLSTLSSQQQQQIKLYGVGMNEEIMEYFFPNGNFFNAIYDIPVKENPMVRPGFKNPKLDNSTKFHEPIHITLAGEKEPFTIEAHEQIASVMLGSQASNDTIDYVENLLKNGMKKVFVFGGKNPNIQEKIDEILKDNPLYKDKIVPLSNQGDNEIASLMSRSNLVVIRGGGLSVMEQLAMTHGPEQTVLIHHANSAQTELTSGISWEDDNATSLIRALKQRGVHTEKTSPQRALRQIAESRLIAAVKRFHKGINIKHAIQSIKKIPAEHLKLCIAELNQLQQLKDPAIPNGLNEWFVAKKRERIIEENKIAEYKQLLVTFEATLKAGLRDTSNSPIKTLFIKGHALLKEIKKTAPQGPTRLKVDEREHLSKVLRYAQKSLNEFNDVRKVKENAKVLIDIAQNVPGKPSPKWRALGFGLLAFVCAALVVVSVILAIPTAGVSLLSTAAVTVGLTPAVGAWIGAGVIAMSAAGGASSLYRGREKGFAKSLRLFKEDLTASSKDNDKKEIAQSPSCSRRLYEY